MLKLKYPVKWNQRKDVVNEFTSEVPDTDHGNISNLECSGLINIFQKELNHHIDEEHAFDASLGSIKVTNLLTRVVTHLAFNVDSEGCKKRVHQRRQYTEEDYKTLEHLIEKIVRANDESILT